MKTKTTTCRWLAALLCAALISTGCVTEGPPPPSSTIALREDPLIGALRDGLDTYDPALGVLAWPAAAVHHIEDGDFDAVVVPIEGRASTRWLVARVDPSAHGPAFRTAVVDLGVEPETGRPVVSAVHDADGTARAMPGGGDFISECHGGCSWMGQGVCTGQCFDQEAQQACMAQCLATWSYGCLVACVVTWIQITLWL